MLVEAFCKKCQNKFMIDIGDSTKVEIIALLEKREGFHCDAGNHMEISSPLNYWDIDWDTIKDGASLTDEEFVEEEFVDFSIYRLRYVDLVGFIR